MDENGTEPAEQVTLPRELVQAIVDYLSTCPAGQVYGLLRRLEAEQLETVAKGADVVDD